MASFCHSYAATVTARCAKSRSSSGFQTDTKIGVLTIVDAFSKLSPAIDVRQHYRGCDVVDTL